MFGRFLELALATQDILASVTFYERLGFTQLLTGDAWSHRYGVLSDGRLAIGLHETAMPSPALAFVLPGVARALGSLRAAGIEPELLELGDEQLHRLRLRDPGGHAVTLLEARTYSGEGPRHSQSRCGYFLELSLPQRDFTAARAFWERAGFIALPEQDEPFAHLPLTSDYFNLAFHQRRGFDAPLLVFECAEVALRLAELAQLGIRPSHELPFGLDPGRNGLIELPEGLCLLLLSPA